MMRFALTALLSLLALPAIAQPLEVVAGEDLTAWREIQQLRPEGDDAITSYQWFLVTYPTSSLAEVAWDRLRELDALEQTRQEHPELRSLITDLERSWSLHQDALSRAPMAVAVAELSSEGAPHRTTTPSWTPALIGGTGYDGAPYGALGMRVEHGPLGLVGRFGRAAEWYGEVGLRLNGPSGARGLEPGLRTGGLLIETTLDTTGTFGALVGGRLLLDPKMWVEAGGGACIGSQGVSPDVRVELVYPL